MAGSITWIYSVFPFNVLCVPSQNGGVFVRLHWQNQTTCALSKVTFTLLKGRPSIFYEHCRRKVLSRLGHNCTRNKLYPVLLLCPQVHLLPVWASLHWELIPYLLFISNKLIQIKISFLIHRLNFFLQYHLIKVFHSFCSIR